MSVSGSPSQQSRSLGVCILVFFLAMSAYLCPNPHVPWSHKVFLGSSLRCPQSWVPGLQEQRRREKNSCSVSLLSAPGCVSIDMSPKRTFIFLSSLQIFVWHGTWFLRIVPIGHHVQNECPSGDRDTLGPTVCLHMVSYTSIELITLKRCCVDGRWFLHLIHHFPGLPFLVSRDKLVSC